MRNKGFTLIELMIAVAIIGIVAAITYPSYTDYVARTNRAEGQQELVRIANLMEQYFLDHRAYPTDLSKLGLTVSGGGVFTGENLYKVTAAQSNNFDYTLTATPQGVQASRDANCGSLTLDSLGTKGADGNAAECWR